MMTKLEWANMLEKRLEETVARAEKAEAFKSWTHQYLDSHGVPHHPPGTHGAAGCRIGDRMDWLMSKLTAAEAEVERLAIKSDAEMERVKACEHIAECDDGWERLENLCPSTAAVAKLKRDFEHLRQSVIAKPITQTQRVREIEGEK